MTLARTLPIIMLPLLASPVLSATCEDIQEFRSLGVTVTATSPMPAGNHIPPGSRVALEMPAHCRVSALLHPVSESEIEMALWLPETWNGRFLAVGNGGWAGSISYEAMARGLQRGYAVASNDTGHKGSSAAFVLESDEKLVDFGHRATHQMAEAAKDLIAWHYSAAPAYSYFQGCSTGGRQGLMAAQRYPDDFDAIIAGAPVNNMFALSAMQMEGYTSILEDRSLFLPEEKVRLLHDAVLGACEEHDGVEDGFLNNPLACDFDPGSLSCASSPNGEACLTPRQVESVRRAYDPLRDTDGTFVYPGHARGFELAWRMPEEGSAPTTLQSDTFQYIVHRDPNWDWREFDLDADFTSAMTRAGEVHAVDPDLSDFKARGGKLLLYHGWNDPGPSPLNTLAYHRDVLETMGEEQDDWLRVFLMPGMEHCRGGIGPDQADFLGAMEAWAEGGEAPESLTSSRLREGIVDMTRPLCPYPQVPTWTGEGNPNDAANYLCRAPD